MKIANEKFTEVFEEVILPVTDEIMEADYLKIEQSISEEQMYEFKEFRGAFQQRLKLFYWRKFMEYKREGREKFFPGDLEHLQKDVYFMYEKFKDFLRKQRKRLDLPLGFLEE